MSALAVPVDLRQLPLRALVAHAARCARRVCPLFAENLEHPEAAICGQALEAAISLCEDFAAERDVDPVLVVSAEEATIRALMLASESAGSDNLAAYVANAAYAAINATRVLLEACVADDPESAAEAVVEAVGIARDAAISADGCVAAAASQDQEILRQLFLGRFPELGDPIDPAASGLLGPLFPPGARSPGPATNRNASNVPHGHNASDEQSVREVTDKSPVVSEPCSQTERPRDSRPTRDKLQRLIAKIRKSHDVLRHRRDALASRRQKLRECERAWQARAAELETRQQTLENQHQELAGGRNSLAADRLRVEQDLQALAGERQAFERDRAILTGEKTALAGEKTALIDSRAQLEHERRTLAGQHQELEELRLALESRQNGIRSRENDLAAQEERLQQERSEFKEGQDRQSQLTHELQADQKRALDTLRAQAQTELGREREELAAARILLEQQRHELDEAAAQLAQQREQLERQSHQVGDQNRQVLDATDQIERQRAALVEREAALAAAQRELATQRESLAHESERHDSRKREILVAEEGVQAEQQRLHSLSERLASQQEELGARESAIQAQEAAQRQRLVEIEEEQALQQESRRAGEEQELHRLREEAKALLNHDRAQLDAERVETESRREQLQLSLQELSRQREAQKAETAQLEAQKQQIVGLNGRLHEQERQLQARAAELAAREQSLQVQDAKLRAAHERSRAEFELFQKERTAFLDEQARRRLERDQDDAARCPAEGAAATGNASKETTPAGPAESVQGNFAEQFLQLQEERRQLQIERVKMQQELTLLRASRERRPSERQTAGAGAVPAGTAARSRANASPVGLIVSAGSAAPAHIAAFLAELRKLACHCGCTGITVSAGDCRLEAIAHGDKSPAENSGSIEFTLMPNGGAAQFSWHELACWNQFQSCLSLSLSADNGVLPAFASGRAASARHPLHKFASEVRKQFETMSETGNGRPGSGLPIDEMHQQRERIDRLIVQLESKFNMQLGLAPLPSGDIVNPNVSPVRPRRGWKAWGVAAALAAAIAAAGYHYVWPSVPDIIARLQ